MPSTRVPALVLGLDSKRNITLCEGPILARMGLDGNQLIGKPISSSDGLGSSLFGLVERAFTFVTLSEPIELAGTACQATCIPVRSANGVDQGVTIVITEDTPSNTGARSTADTENSDQSSEAPYQHLFDSITDICIVIDRDWRYTAINAAGLRAAKVSLGEIIGKSVFDFLPEQEHKPLLAPYRLVIESGSARQFVSERPLLPNCAPGSYDLQVHLLSGGLMCIAHDITDRVRAEEAIRSSEERYHTLFEESREASFITTLDGAIVDFNHAALDLFGMTRQDISEVMVQDLYVDPADRETLIEMMSQQGAIRDFPTHLRRRDGSVMDCVITASVWRAPDGTIMGYQGLVRDITVQQRANQALQESESRFRAIFESTALGIAVIDLTGTPMIVNPPLEAMVERTQGELRTLTLRELTHPDDRAEIWEMFTDLVKGGRDHFQFAARLLTSSNEIVWTNLTVSVVWETEGSPLYAIAVAEDIRERKRAEDALRESEDRYRRLVDLSPEPLTVHVGGRLVYANKACAVMLGAATTDELLGRSILEFVHPDFEDMVKSRIHLVQDQREEAPLTQEKFIRLDGKAIDVEVVSIPIVYHGQVGSQVIARDITERVRAQASENALAEALSKSSAALNSTLDLDEVLRLLLISVGQVVPHDSATVMLIDDQGVASVVGHQGYAERGFAEELKALRFSVDYVPNLAQMQRTRQAVIVNNLDEFKGWVKTRHTEWIKSYVGTPILQGDSVIGFLGLESAQPNFFTQQHARNLQTFAEQAATAIRNARLYADLTRHAAELQDRNSDLDAFSHTVAHDLKAPLHVIIGYSSLILSDYKDQVSTEVLGYIDNVAQYANKLDTLIESMMVLAKLRSSEAQIVPVRPRPLAESAVDRFKRQIAEKNIRIEVAGEFATVMGYAPWVEEVFANLIENAIKYLGSKNPSPYIGIRGTPPHNGKVRFQVEDNGIGISEENLQGLFKMFSRVHPSGDIKGAGLGLSIVERIVNRLNGELGVESTPGKGSIFWFTLQEAPADDSPPSDTESTSSTS